MVKNIDWDGFLDFNNPCHVHEPNYVQIGQPIIKLNENTVLDLFERSMELLGPPGVHYPRISEGHQG